MLLDMTFTSTKSVTVEPDRIAPAEFERMLTDDGHKANGKLYPIEAMMVNGGEYAGKRYVRLDSIIVNAKFFTVLDKFLGKPVWLAGENRIVAVDSGRAVGVIMGVSIDGADFQYVKTIRTQ